MTIKTNLSTDEQEKLLTYARPNRYPYQELRYFDGNPKQPSLSKYTENILISCDVDNSVLVFKMRDYPTVPDDFVSITAISYNPKGTYDPNFKFNDNPESVYTNADDVPNPEPIPTLESTRSYILTSMFKVPELQHRSVNRLIQCDLCVQPSNNSRDVRINNYNISRWSTIKAAMDKSQFLFLGWGSGPYDSAKELIDDLKSCDKFDVDAFYKYLKDRIDLKEVYTLGFSKNTYQPYQPAAIVTKVAKPLSITDLDLMFDINKD